MSLAVAFSQPAALPQPGWAIVRIETDTAVYRARVYLPAGARRVWDLLSDPNPFLALTDVSTEGTTEVEHFIALNKHWVRTLRVLLEVDGSEEPARRQEPPARLAS